jgi:hypothetical protein
MGGRPSVEATGLGPWKRWPLQYYRHARPLRCEVSRLQRALAAGAITLGFIVIGSLCPTMLGGGAEWASQSDFQILSSGFSRWSALSLGRVFWFALVFASALICFLMTW